MSNLDNFISQYYGNAVQASQLTGVSANVILAQAALESSYGASAPENNLFGVKGSGGTTQTTSEYLNGQWVKIKAAFAGYSSPADSFNGYASFINGNKRYSGVAGAGSDQAQANALQAAGYATDPNYASKVGTLAAQINAKVNAGVGTTIKNAMASVFGADNLATLGQNLAAPGNAIDASVNKLIGGLNPSQWFQRIALALLAILLIGIALSMLASKAGVNIVSKSPVPLPV